MRLFLFFAGLLLLAVPCQGQKVKYSSPQKIGDRNLYTTVAASNAKYIVSFRQHFKNPIFSLWSETYNHDLKRLSSAEIFRENEGKVLTHHISDSTITFAFLKHDRASGKVNIMTRHADLMYRRTTDKKLAEVDGPLEYAKTKMEFDTAAQAYRFFYLKDEGGEAVAYEMSIDTGGHVTGHRTLALPLNRDAYPLQYLTLNGISAAVVREPIHRRELRQQYRLYLVYNSGGQLGAQPMYTDSLLATDAKLVRDRRSGAIIVAGLYSKPDTSYLKGYFVWRHEGGSEKPVFRFNTFSDHTLTQMAGRNSRIEGLYNLRMGDIIVREDGGLVMVAEEHHVSEELFNDIGFNGMSQTNVRYYFYYNNLLLINLNPDHTLQWASVMRKDQVSMNDNGIYSSYLLHLHPGRAYLVYNDLSRRNWSLSYYVVDQLGKPESNIIIPADHYDARMFPRDGLQTAFNEAIVPAYNKRGYLLVKISF